MWNEAFGWAVDWIKNQSKRVGDRCRVHLSSGFQQWRRFQTSMPTEKKKPSTNLCQTSPKTLPVPLRMASNPIPSLETELSSNPSNCSAQVQVPSFYYYFLIHSLFGKPKKMKQAKFCVFSVLFFFFCLGNSRALREMEEKDPRAFDNGAEDSGLSITHTGHSYVNDGSNFMLYPPSKKARKSWSNLDAKVCLL